MPHPLMLMLLLLTPPLLLLGGLHSLPIAPLGFIGLIAPLIYIISQRDAYQDWKQHLLAFPVLLLVGTGMLWNNSYAMFRGLVQQGGEFRRTPKFVGAWHTSGYAMQGKFGVVVELLLMAYALWGAWLAWQIERALMPYLLLYAMAFGTVAAWEMFDSWRIAQVSASLRASAVLESGSD